MKSNKHPQYGMVIMKDAASDFTMLTRSTRSSTQTAQWHDGQTYPLITVEVSSASHPFYTGQQRQIDTAGRIDTFHKKYGTDYRAK
ncbi:MAG: type B 50S ribosomal protein L31 [Proteobacteria bacterium]|nr:MAG: type B 50S ribosomal protein L31 [Pseudomonadota bacterium]